MMKPLSTRKSVFFLLNNKYSYPNPPRNLLSYAYLEAGIIETISA